MSTIPSHNLAAYLPQRGGVDHDDVVSNRSFNNLGVKQLSTDSSTSSNGLFHKKSQDWYPPPLTFLLTTINFKKSTTHSIITSISSITKTSDVEKCLPQCWPKFGTMITLRGTETMQVRRGFNAYGAIIHLAIGIQQGWYGTYFGLRVRALLSALVQFHQII